MSVRALDQRQELWARRWGWLVIALAVLAAYWPLSSFQWAVAHGDTLNCWLPWRWFIASCLRDGRFPLWNPHQQFGYPLHADLQGPAWYPEAIALGGTVGHGIHVLQALYLLYLMIGGWGMMRLTRSVHGDARAGLITGAAYAMGGFLTGHQQHFYAIISAAWMPWLLWAFLGLLRAPGWRWAARVAVLQGLLLTGGNHTFTIIGAYVLAALFALHAVQAWRAEGWFALRAMTGWSLAAGVGAALIGIGALHAWWESAPHLARGGALPYATAAQGAATGAALRSLLLPFTPLTAADAPDADPSMGNLYLGALLLAFTLAALLRRRTALEQLLLGVLALCGLASLGAATPVHAALWRWLPGMDLFRFPSYFHLFTWLAALILAGGTVRAWLAEELRAQALLLPLALLTAAAWAAGAVGASTAGSLPMEGSLFERMRALDAGWHLLLGAAITAPLLTVALVAAWRHRLGFALLLGLLLGEMAWSTSLAVWNTAVSDIHPAWLQRRLGALSESPVVPEPLPTKAYVDSGERLHYLAHATQDYLGGFSRNGVNSFWLRNAMDLEVRHTALWEAMARQPVAYLAERVIPASAYAPDAIGPERDSGLVVMMEGAVPVRDTGRATDDAAELVGFDRDAFTIRSSTGTERLLVLQQSHYPGWEAVVDGVRRPLLRVNIAAMGVAVPAGAHEVVFRYRKPMVPWLLALAQLAFFGLLFGLAWPSGNPLLRAGALALLGLTAWSLLGNTRNRSETDALLRSARSRLPGNASVILNDDGSSMPPTTGDQVGWRLRADDAGKALHAWAVLQAAARHRTAAAPDAPRALHWFDAALKTDPAIRAMLLDHWEARVLAVKGRSTHLELAPRGTPLEGRLLLAPDTALRWLHADAPFGGGVSVPMDSLRAFRDGSLVIDVLARARRAARAAIVIERKRGEAPTEYRALPIHAGSAEAPAYAVQPIDELWRPGESLKIYLWSHQGDSLSERALRVRALPRRFDAW